jgi:hypothetical protein
MHQINLLDETFDKNQAHHYNLSIQYGLNGLTFCVFDTLKNKYIGLSHYPEEKSKPDDVGSLIKSDDILGLPYKEVLLLSNSGQSTLVPLEFFEESKVEDLYQFNLGTTENSIIHYNKLAETSACNIFSFSTPFLKQIKNAFPSLLIYHRTTPFIENLVQESVRWARTKCYLSVNKGIIDIGLAHQKKLEFFNSFTYKEKSDIVYFVLNVLEQYKLSAALTDIFISVDLEEHNEIFELLNGYLQQVKFIRPSENFTFSYIFDDFQLTRFANLFNLVLCVS